MEVEILSQQELEEINTTRCAVCGKKLPIVGHRIYASFCDEFDKTADCQAKYIRGGNHAQGRDATEVGG